MVGAFWEIGVCSLSISGTVGLRLGRIDFQGRKVVTVMRFVYITIAYIAIVYIALVILKVGFSRIVRVVFRVIGVVVRVVRIVVGIVDIPLTHGVIGIPLTLGIIRIMLGVVHWCIGLRIAV
jgi:hypothetical protein